MNRQGDSSDWSSYSSQETIRGSSSAQYEKPTTSTMSGMSNMYINLNNAYERNTNRSINIEASDDSPGLPMSSTGFPADSNRLDENFMHQQGLGEENAPQGLSREQLKKIKRMVMKASSRQCSICFLPFVDGEVIRKLPCKHIFHEKCVIPWLMKISKCPNCRFDLLEWLDKEEQEENSGGENSRR